MLQKVRKQALLWYNVVITQREAFTMGIVFLHGVHGVHTQQGSHYISAKALHCSFEFSKLPTEGANCTGYLMDNIQGIYHEKCPVMIVQRDEDQVKLK